ncbi:MAG TPA: ComEC/Rec2 family competence protein [Terracidiphilus sp.]|nr:ComEC/Rec2 family competence protein [Terracidiphilus sp.]
MSAIPLFHAAWLFAAGIVLAQALWLRPACVLIAFVPVAALCCLAACRAQRVVWVPVAVLWILLGAWCAEMEPHPAPAVTVAALSDGLARTVEGTIVADGPVRSETVDNLDEPVSSEWTQSLDLRISSIEVVTDTEDEPARAAGGVRLTVFWPQTTSSEQSPRPFHCGQRVRAVVRLQRPRIYRDPGAWSRADYLLDQGITSTAFAGSDEIDSTGMMPGTFLACRMGELQHAVSARLLALPQAMRRLPPALRLSSEDAVILAAMTTGDRTYLTHALRAGFERTGSFHMLVVSGLHLAIVAGCIFWFTRKLRIPRVAATLATIAATTAYALFTGFGTPVQRALWMIAIYLLGRLLYRERSALNSIGLAALGLLAISPRSLFDTSLQMTLLAVIAIAGVAVPLLRSTLHPMLTATRDLSTIAIDAKLPPRFAQFRVSLRMFAERLQRVASARIAWRLFPASVQLLLGCIEALVVSCVVELAMTLPMAIYFHRVTVFALPVNILILPLLTVIMPVALLMLLALVAWPSAAVLPGAAAALLIHIGVGLVRIFGAFPGADLRVPTPLAWQSAGFCVLLTASLLLARGSRWHRRAALAAMLLAAAVAVVPRPVQHPRNALLVEALDVGQGDSLLVITPDGRTMLVDGGGYAGYRQSPQNFDIGEDVVSTTLWARGIRQLDVVALSHAHSDHMGGLPAVLRNFHPHELWVGNNPPVAAYTALLEQAAQLHIHVRGLRAGDRVALGAAQVQVLAPFASYKPGPEPSNDDSLVLHVAYGATSALLEGDAEAPVEEAMLAEPGLNSTLLKVAHHGSSTSTQPQFLARVAPRWAVISCGLHNRYGHPRAEVLSELQAAGVKTYSTDIDGATCFRLDGKRVDVDSLCGQRSLSSASEALMRPGN